METQINLNKSQKKILKKNLKKLNFAEIAKRIQIDEETLRQYLKENLPEEKYSKLVEKKEDKKDNSTRQTIFPSNLSSWLKKNWLSFLFLTVLIAIAYINSLKNEFLSDDIAGIVQDRNMGNLLYYLRNNTINFFRYFFYCLVYKIFGLNQVFFRLLNLGFHLGSVFLVFTLLSFLVSPLVALFAAGIFAVHPLQIEALVWITGGIHAQYAFFDLFSFFFYLLASSRNWQKKYYYASLFCFIVALLTTEKSAILPLIILAFELTYGKIKTNWQKIIPFFILSGLCAFMVLFGGNFGNRISLLKTQYYQEEGLYNPLTQIPTAISSYLSLAFWPNGLTLYHSEMSFSTPKYIFMVTVTLLYFAAVFYTFWKKNLRYLSFWLSIFFLCLLPMLTPFKVAWIVAERYTYLGIIGIYVIAAILLDKLGEKFRKQKLSYIIFGLLLALLISRTISRNLDWRNQDYLWLSAAKTSPSSPQNHNNLGDLYSRRGDFSKAVTEFQAAINLLPNYADAFHNLANTYLQMNQIDLAIENYQNALKYNPTLWQSHQNLTAIYVQQKKFDLAEYHVKKALEIYPNNPVFHNVLAFIYQQTNKITEAKKEIQITLQIDPENQDAIKLRQSLP
ncbi:MAG: tetratricopeptide repeat protein [Patescibacteria group bacterium]|nr:tetratricopeptide repeat protein [Patescibacteria group bacterium]